MTPEMVISTRQNCMDRWKSDLAFKNEFLPWRCPCPQIKDCLHQRRVSILQDLCTVSVAGPSNISANIPIPILRVFLIEMEQASQLLVRSPISHAALLGGVMVNRAVRMSAMVNTKNVS